MSTLPTPLNLTDAKVDVDALHLSVTTTRPRGNMTNLHVLEDHDLRVVRRKSQAARTLRAAELGQIVIALGVDDDHDEVLFHYKSGEEAVECLLSGIEALQTAIAGIERVRRA